MTWDGLTPPYATIVADPPWPYEDNPLGDYNGGRLKRFLSYSTMTVEQIAALPVVQLSQPGSHLYLWTTNRHLRSTYGIAEAWGFDPITVLVWCKEPRGLGAGGRFTITTEFVLFCRDRRRAGAMIHQAREAAGLGRADVHRRIRGGKPTGIVFRWEADDCLPTEQDWQGLQETLPMLAKTPYPVIVPSQMAKVDRSWWQWKRGPHSTKPPAFLDIVEQVSPAPRVELFARAQRLGWDSWGWGYEGATG